MSRKRVDVATLIPGLFILGYVVLLYWCTLYARLIMDEFLLISWSGDLVSGLRPYVDFIPYKTVLGSYVYCLPFFVTDKIENILLLGRQLGFLTAVASIAVLGVLHKRVFSSPKGALWAVLWTLTCSTFLERSFRIRVEMLTTLLALLAVWQFVSIQNWRRNLMAGIWLCLAFCVTQKAAFFIFAFFVAYWLAYAKPAARPVRDFVVFGAAGLFVFLVYVVVFGFGGHYVEVVKTTLLGKSLAAVTLESSYEGLYRFYGQTFWRNMVFYGMSFSGLLYVLISWRSEAWEKKFAATFTLIVLLLLIVHRKPWPYVFVMVIPFLGLFAGHLSQTVFDALKGSPRLLVALAVLLCVIVIPNSIRRFTEHMQIDIFPQLQTVRSAEAALGLDDVYFDGICMIGTRRHVRLGSLDGTGAEAPLDNWSQIFDKRRRSILLENWETEGPRLFEALRKAQCKVIIHNYRFESIPDEFQEFIDRHYTLMDLNVYVSGSEITSSPQTVHPIWGGDYGFLAKGDCRNVEIDGRPVSELDGKIHLEPGEYTVRYEGNGSLLLVPIEAWKHMRQNKFDRRTVEMFFRRYHL